MAHAKPRPTDSTIGPDKLIESIWNGLKPCARKLRDIIMQSNTPFRYPPGLEPPSTRSKLPSLTHRRIACTHLTMDRLYGNFRCNVCNRTSELGWVYTCNQDDEADTIEAFELMMKEEPVDTTSRRDVNDHRQQPTGKENSMMTAQLNPWVEKAIANGHYTEKQIANLRAQKQNVFDTTTAAIEEFEQSQKETHSPPQPASKPQPSDTNPHLPFPVILEAHEPLATESYPRKGSSEVPRLQMFPHCNFRACQLCRPTYRDRTWLCLDEIFNNPPPSLIPILNDETRPMASLSLMRNIGLRDPKRPPRPPLRAYNKNALYDFDAEGKITRADRPSHRTIPDTIGQSGDVADATVEEPESRGFRESMKRTFKGMLAARQAGARRWRTRESTPSSSSDEDAAEFDMGLWQEMNDELLKEASSVPLPKGVRNAGDAESVGECEIGGVAVTEESAEVGRADIIVSV